MPQIFKIGSFWVYFWSDEGRPLEPIHVHVAEGRPVANGTKIWITKTGKCLVAHNKSNIPDKTLRDIMRMIEARSKDIIEKWVQQFDELNYYC
jgi:hypothetical protein